MTKYLDKVWNLILVFKHFGISYIPRQENAQVEALSRLATSANNSIGQAYIEYLEVPNIDKVEKVQ